MSPIMNIKPKAKTPAKPAARKATPAKPARRGTAKPAAKTGSTRKPAAKKATTAKKAAPARERISEAQLNKHLKILEKGKERLDKAQREHDASSRNAHEIAQEALSAGVPMKIVSETLEISRQYLYKGYKGTRATKDSRGTTNGSGSKAAAKTAVKRTIAKKPAASTKTTTAKKRPVIRKK